MSYIRYVPTVHVVDLHTSANVVIQIWQELVMLRHIDLDGKVNAFSSTTSWIDQAKTYFLDACNSNWRSAGLLYYYSFLNLAKAFLVKENVFNFKYLDSTAVHHGLSASLQKVDNLLDYKIKIFPPSSGKHHNVFSLFYEVVCDQKWPFDGQIEISLREIITYCEQLTGELKGIYSINASYFDAQSLMRKIADQAWFEMLINEKYVSAFKDTVNNWISSEIRLESFTEEDILDWRTAHHRDNATFQNQICLRGPIFKAENTSDSAITTAIQKASDDITKNLQKFTQPSPQPLRSGSIWYFVPNTEINNQKIKWSLLLSDYLMAFALASILRYQPQLLKANSDDSFIAEAWCNQASVACLRNFLMLFTTPALRISTL